MTSNDRTAPDHTIRQAFHITPGAVITGTEGASGRYISGQHRLEWDLDALGVDPALANWVAAEAALWDDWADQAPPATVPPPDRPKHHHTAGWLNRYPELRKALQEAGVTLDMTDKTVLDIGGSGKDMVYWLADRPARIDQVEVSPQSQALCLNKLAATPAVAEVPVFFHTVPAEHLPFDDAAFDIVFSRSTIHHCARPKVLDQVYRVLKPGGLFVFTENYRGRLLHGLMRLDRWLRRRDRGTDDPLHPRHVAYCMEQYARSAAAYKKSVFGMLPFAQARTWIAPGPATALHVTFAGRK